MAKRSHRRCYFFNVDGDPIKGGCDRRSSSCGYYHPDEEGWDTARIPTHRGSKKRRRSLTPSPYRRRDSGYGTRNKQSCSRSRSRSPARRSRRDSIASSAPESPQTSRTSRPVESDSRKMSLTDMSSNNGNKGPQQAQSSTSSTLRSSPPKTQVPSSSSLHNPTTVSLPTPPVTAFQAGGFGEVPFPDLRSRITTTTISTNPKPLLPSSPSNSFHQRWPSLTRSDASTPLVPPKDFLPMRPPQPLPAVPPALSAGVAPQATVEPTIEEKRALWEERTRILSESELAREHLAGLEDQVVFALQIVESRYFNNQPEEDKTRLKDQLAELEKQRDEAKRIHEESLENLFRSGSWPTGLPSSIDDSMEEKQKEVLKYIQELKDTASQTSKMLGDISTLQVPPLFLADSDEDEDGALMDIDKPSGDIEHRKSLKRRRISGSGGHVPPMPTQRELDEFLERLAHMEGLISTLENDIHEHSHEAREEFGLLVDAKLDEFQVAREQEEKQRLEEEQQQMQDLEHDITLAGEQVGELATEIGDLIIRVGKLEVDVAASRKRRQESFEKVLEVERRLQEYVSTREADVLAIQTFEKALNAYSSRPPSPPATPVNVLPSFDYIYQNLEEPIVQALRSHLVPAIEDLRKDVEDMVRARNAELYSTLWNKITVTLKVLEMIQSKINQGDIEPAQSLAENVVKL